ncbi:MAG: membrane protein [Gammaproteobacteria bacterium]|jgi:membrane protein
MKARINDYIWSNQLQGLSRLHSHFKHYLQIFAVVGRDLASGMLTLRAMSLVYTTLLSIVPLLAVSISVLKGFGVHDQLEPALVQLLHPLGERSTEISAKMVEFVENMKIGVLGALGLSLLIFTVVSLIQKIESAFNYTWRLNGNRNLMQRFSNYLSVVLVGPVLIFSAVGITASLGSNTIVELLNNLPYMNDLLRLVSKVVPYILVILAFTFVYILVPNTRVAPKSAFFGALVAGTLWETSGLIFTSFVGSSTQYTAIYSGFAIMMMFMIWLYLSWLILLIGASMAYYHQHPERLQWIKPVGHISARLREQFTLQAMTDIARSHCSNQPTATDLQTLAQSQKISIELLKRMLDALESAELVALTNSDPIQYLPARSADRISLNDILTCAREAESDRQSHPSKLDPAICSLLETLETQRVQSLGQQSLADLIESN